MGRTTLKEAALPSVVAQSKQFSEIIIVFDLPESETLKEAHDNQTVLFTGGNSGGPAARKLAYHYAKGDYIVILDDDDQLDVNFVKNLHNSLQKLDVEPALVIPKVRKIWPEGGIPSIEAFAPKGHSNQSGYVDLSTNDWLPSTSSGLILNKELFPEYPTSGRIQGFNDVQIVAAARSLGHPAFFSCDTIVYFYQYFSIDRLTSNLSSRIRNLEEASAHGLRFSPDEKKKILMSSAFSQARSIAYNEGLIAALSNLKSNAKILNCTWRSLLNLRAAVNLSVLIYIAATNLLRGRT